MFSTCGLEINIVLQRFLEGLCNHGSLVWAVQLAFCKRVVAFAHDRPHSEEGPHGRVKAKTRGNKLERSEVPKFVDPA